MKREKCYFVIGLAVGAFSLLLIRRYHKMRAKTLAWQKQQGLILDVLTCPTCHISLTLKGESLHCAQCQKIYPIVDGVPHFIEQQELTGMNQRFSRLYDWFSWGYRAFSKIAFAAIGMSEEQARREVTDCLDPRGGRVLEVSIGPGVNLPYLVERTDVGEIFGLDISPGQLKRCQEHIADQDWNIQLHLGNAEQLPYQDKTFDGVFHIGGINFFNNKKAAIDEMIRVAKPGTRILICDEKEKGAQAYERFLPRFKRMFEGQRKAVIAPVGLIPPEMQDVRLFDVWKGWFYCIEFRKP